MQDILNKIAIYMLIISFLPSCEYSFNRPKSFILNPAPNEDTDNDGEIEIDDEPEDNPISSLKGFPHDDLEFKIIKTLSYERLCDGFYKYQLLVGIESDITGRSLKDALKSLIANHETRPTLLVNRANHSYQLIFINYEQKFINVWHDPKHPLLPKDWNDLKEYYEAFFQKRLFIRKDFSHLIQIDHVDPNLIESFGISYWISLIEAILKNRSFKFSVLPALNLKPISQDDMERSLDYYEKNKDKQTESRQINYPLEEADFYLLKKRWKPKAAIRLAMLGDEFERVEPDHDSLARQNTFIREKRLINSVLAKGHTGIFAYADYFTKMYESTGFDIWRHHTNSGEIKRVIGYSFRADLRGPIESDISKCDKEWYEGYEIGKTHYQGWQEGCGIKQTLGFWPTFVRSRDQKLIDNLLQEYEKRHGVSFDPNEQNPMLLAQDIKPLDNPGELTNSILTTTLNWYLNNVLNLYAHVSDNYQLKGFISTTRSPVIAKMWYKGEFYVYVTYVEGGFRLPKPYSLKVDNQKGQKIDFNLYDEQEIAVAGGIEWADIMAYAKVKNQKYTGEIYIRQGFKEMDPLAYRKIILALSGSDSY